MKVAEIQRAVRMLRNEEDAAFLQRFFKTGPGEYGEGDRFLGIRVPAIRKLANQFGDAPRRTVLALLKSPWHEERLLALLLMVSRFRRGGEPEKRQGYEDYLAHTAHINNWDLVDTSAEHVVGAWLFERSRKPLYRLARSRNLWERRIAIMATFHFIRRHDVEETFRLAEVLLHDEEDLLHKAVGWMLREAEKRDPQAARQFLDRHAATMPRTMLRYALEKFPPAERKGYMRRVEL